MARTKVARYREAYATRPGTTYAFLPCVMSTSGRIHREFLRLLYILAHRRTLKYFAAEGPGCCSVSTVSPPPSTRLLVLSFFIGSLEVFFLVKSSRASRLH